MNPIKTSALLLSTLLLALPAQAGDGAPMFRRIASRVELKLAECRQLANQCVFVLYTVEAGGR